MANNASPTRIPLILTRPQSASEGFFATLPDTVRARFDPIISPLIDIVPLVENVPMTADDAAIFTSAHGVHCAPKGQGRSAFCVGLATTRAAKDRGWLARHFGTDAESLVANLTSIRPAQRLFHLSGLHTRGDVVGRLNGAGLRAQNIALYEQRLCGLTKAATQALLKHERLVAPLFSPRTAAHFCDVAPCTANVHVVALSAAVADAMASATVASMTIAVRPDAQAMGAALGDLLRAKRLD